MKYLLLFFLANLAHAADYMVTVEMSPTLDGFRTLFVNKERPDQLLFCQYDLQSTLTVSPTENENGIIHVVTSITRKSSNDHCYHGLGHDFGVLEIQRNKTTLPDGFYDFQVDGIFQGTVILEDQIVTFEPK